MTNMRWGTRFSNHTSFKAVPRRLPRVTRPPANMPKQPTSLAFGLMRGITGLKECAQRKRRSGAHRAAENDEAARNNIAVLERLLQQPAIGGGRLLIERRIAALRRRLERSEVRSNMEE